VKRAPSSLKAQALALLARREHSRAELRGKLLAHARKRALWAASQAGLAHGADVDDDAEATAAPAEVFDVEAATREVEAVLDALQAAHHLSDARFAESRVHARASRQGLVRIRLELARHGVELDADSAQALRDTELARAREVWRRKYGGRPPADAAERARQMRFLAGRGFAAEVVRRVVGGRDED
jgi:regulatory protein